MKHLWILTLFVCLPAAGANVTIDFNEFAPLNTGVGYTFDSQGFRFTDLDPVPFADEIRFNDLGAGYDSGPIWMGTLSMESINGSSFDLLTYDWAAIGEPMTVVGYYSGGGSTQVVMPFASSSLTNYTFDSAWSDLIRVDFISYNTVQDEPSLGVTDNIVVSQVPIPAAVWLFGSALAGLGWIRRKQTV